MNYILYIWTAVCFLNVSVHGVTDCTYENECVGAIISDNIVRCRDLKVCEFATISATSFIKCVGEKACLDAEQLMGTKNVTCGGRYACQRATSIMSSEGSIYCRAMGACQRAVSIMAADSVNCVGDSGCAISEAIVATNDVLCSARNSCFKTLISSTHGNVNCSGSSSCSKATINAYNIYCSQEGATSYRSCQQGTLNAVNDVFLSAGYATYRSIVNAGGDIHCTERLCGYQGTLTATNIYVDAYNGASPARFVVAEKLICKGEKACSLAKKISSSTNTLYVEFNGFQAGSASKIFCPKICTINCTAGGCVSESNVDTKVFYSPDTNLTIYPLECMEENASNSCPLLQRRRNLTALIKMSDEEEWYDDDEAIDDAEFIDDDFMSYVGMELKQETDYVSSSYFISAVVVGLGIMVIAAFIYYYCNAEEKYETIQ